MNLAAVGPTLTAEVCVSSRVRKNTGTVQHCTLYTVHTGHCTTLAIPTPTPHSAGKKLGTVSYQSLLINIEVELFEEIFCGVDCGYLLLNIILETRVK